MTPDLAGRVAALELAVLAIATQRFEPDGHPFNGNQYTTGQATAAAETEHPAADLHAVATTAAATGTATPAEQHSLATAASAVAGTPAPTSNDAFQTALRLMINGQGSKKAVHQVARYLLRQHHLSKVNLHLHRAPKAPHVKKPKAPPKPKAAHHGRRRAATQSGG